MEAGMKVYTEEQAINSLFTEGGTLALEGIEVKKHRKNAVDVYFTYKGKEFCLNRHNVILKYSTPESLGGRKWFQYGGLEFDTPQEYQTVVDSLKTFLNR
jgi:hypothetical protein